ncbi:MAG: hypothetical protein ACI8ZM_000516 [Crocinitomix sp.]|jgi:hypothetical protein
MNKPFEQYFQESYGQPFTYEGKTIQISLRQLLKENSTCSLENFKTNSDWRQGIVVRAVKGDLKFKDQINSGFVFWEENFGDSIDITFLKGKILLIYNVWDTGNGTMQYGHNGAGINVVENEGRITLNCNDAHPTAELNHLVFDLKIEK